VPAFFMRELRGRVVHSSPVKGGGPTYGCADHAPHTGPSRYVTRVRTRTWGTGAYSGLSRLLNHFDHHLPGFGGISDFAQERDARATHAF
jgi:hypothetical protein